MEKLTANMIPRCMGRYILDLPKIMRLNDQHHTKIGDVIIRIEPLSNAGFKARLLEREEKLKSIFMIGEPDNPFLKSVIALPEGIEGKIFNRAESETNPDFGRILELHAWINNYHVTMELEANDLSDTKYRDDTLVQQLSNNLTEKLSTLLELIRRTHGRNDLEIPSGQGVCIPNGFIRGPAMDKEDIGLAYELAEDVWLHFENDSGISETSTLLDRAKDIEWGERENEGRTVRKGRRVANDIKFEEWLSALRTNDHVMGHSFMLEANSLIGSAKTPLIIVELFNGSRAPRPEQPYDSPPPPTIEKATLSEAEAIALWDAITSTLRPRPGAF